jgi:hypothetical protein
MARRGTRKNGLVTRITAPFRHLFQATGESAALVGARAGKIAKMGINTGEGVLGSFAKHTNQAVRNLTRRRGGRRASRRASRRANRSRRA